MKTIRSVLTEILIERDYVREALGEGLLNLSAFAKKVQAEISKQIGRKVPINTIVVALSRLQSEAAIQRNITPKFRASDISVKTGLIELAYEKTERVKALLPRVALGTKLTTTDFFALTIGLSQISFIVPIGQAKGLKERLSGIKPLFSAPDLAAVTLRFGAEYLTTPGVIHSLVTVVTAKGVNIVEIVSTVTELSVLVKEGDLEATFLAWHRFMASKT